MANSQAKKKPDPAQKSAQVKKPIKKPAPKPVAKKASAKKPIAKAAAKPVRKSPPAAKAKPSPKPQATKKQAAPAKTTMKKPTPMATKPAAKAPAKSTAAKAAPAKAAAKPAPKPRREYKPAKLPAGYKPTASEAYMNPQQEEYFRQKLLAWRKALMDESRETLDHLHEENWHQADIADRAALETEAGVELRTRNRYLKLVSKIDAAIRRIEDGEYGYCEETGEPIGLKRLEARPVATLSIEAQERHEKNEKQYTDDD